MLNTLTDRQDSLGKPDQLLADNGYFSKDNIQACVNQNIEPFIAMGRDSHHIPLAERLQAEAPEPESSDPLIKMAWKLKTKKGRACYGKRKCTVEPVFGIIKHVLGSVSFH